jgi:hypothetical protein
MADDWRAAEQETERSDENVLQIEWMNQIQISIFYELIVFVYNVHLHEIVKLRKTEKKSANLPHLRGKLALL